MVAPLLLAVPALILVAWQLPPVRPARRAREPGPAPGGQAAPLRVLTLNVKGGPADAEAIAATVAALEVDILAVQELTAGWCCAWPSPGWLSCCRSPSSTRGEGSRGSRAVDPLAADPAGPGGGHGRGGPRARIDPARRPGRHRHRRAPGRPGGGPGTSLAAGSRADPVGRWPAPAARSWRPGTSTPAGTTARSVPCSGPASWTAPTRPASGTGPASPGRPTAATRR